MPADFFEPFGPSVEFLNQKDFEAKWQEIGTEVPARTRGRTPDHRERFCLNAYLRYALDEGWLTFPFEVRKDEGPDCWITWDDRSLGWEHTDAGSPEHQKWLTETETGPEEVSISPGDGSVGGYLNQQWRDDVWSAIARKLKLYGGRPPGGSEGCDLFVYDNTETEILSEEDFSEAAAESAMADIRGRYRDFVGPNAIRQPFRRVLVQSVGGPILTVI